MNTNTNIDVAIVGGGIVGLVLALGLLRRGFQVNIYEKAREFHEIGAGVAFTANAQRCMELLDPHILEAMRKVANKNPNDHYQYVDGYNHQSDDPADNKEELLFQIYAGDVGFDGCHRAHFLDKLVSLLPSGVVEFQRRFNSYHDPGNGQKLALEFADGSRDEADLVVGCDGIKSRVRQTMFGNENPVSHAQYSHKVAYRGLIPMDRAVTALGRDRAFNQCMHMGPRAHILNFPVAMHTMLNVVAFVDDPSDWSIEGKMDVPASRDEVVAAFAGWGPAVRTMVDLLPDELTKWAIFDTYDHPAPSYALGRVCLAGDAAHASSPHHGAGAGFGVEDALALSELLEQARDTLEHNTLINKAEIIAANLQAYSKARHERGQWLVQSSREVCEVYEWAHSATGGEPDKCKQEIEWRAHRIWYFDIEGMLKDAKDDFRRRLEEA
ncbi:FAD binding domain protein [Penicillium sp. CMV-2018d]|nr:FAD binding domain protein [Penicillium sp. CMV-2018d]